MDLFNKIVKKCLRRILIYVPFGMILLVAIFAFLTIYDGRYFPSGVVVGSLGTQAAGQHTISFSENLELKEVIFEGEPGTVANGRIESSGKFIFPPGFDPSLIDWGTVFSTLGVWVMFEDATRGSIAERNLFFDIFSEDEDDGGDDNGDGYDGETFGVAPQSAVKIGETHVSWNNKELNFNSWLTTNDADHAIFSRDLILNKAEGEPIELPFTTEVVTELRFFGGQKVASVETKFNATINGAVNGRYTDNDNLVGSASLSGTGSSDEESVVDHPPVADAGPDQIVESGKTVFLNGSNSYDPDGTPIHYKWNQFSKNFPKVILSDATSSVSSFTAPIVDQKTNLSFLLDVLSNGAGDRDTTQVTVVKTGTPTRILSVAKSGNGKGAVSSSTAGIDCGTSCSAPFPLNTEVILTALPDEDNIFSGWRGDCAGFSPKCPVILDADKTAEAIFEPMPPVFISQPLNNGFVVPGSKINFTIQFSKQTQSLANKTKLFRIGKKESICVDKKAPYNCEWSVPIEVGKVYEFQAKAYNKKNKIIAVSPVIKVTSAITNPPIVQITYPLNGQQVLPKKKTTINASISNAPSGTTVKQVAFFVNGNKKCIDKKAPYSCGWNVPSGSGKTKKIQAKARVKRNDLPSIVVLPSEAVTVTTK